MPFVRPRNPETSVRCAECRAALQRSLDDRTMDSPGELWLHLMAKLSFLRTLWPQGHNGADAELVSAFAKPLFKWH